MAGFGDDVLARWSHIQGTLFPWLREELDPVTAVLEQLIIVLDTIGLAAYVPGPPRLGAGFCRQGGIALADHGGGDRAIGHRQIAAPHLRLGERPRGSQ